MTTFVPYLDGLTNKKRTSYHTSFLPFLRARYPWVTYIPPFSWASSAFRTKDKFQKAHAAVRVRQGPLLLRTTCQHSVIFGRWVSIFEIPSIIQVDLCSTRTNVRLLVSLKVFRYFIRPSNRPTSFKNCLKSTGPNTPPTFIFKYSPPSRVLRKNHGKRPTSRLQKVRPSPSILGFMRSLNSGLYATNSGRMPELIRKLEWTLNSRSWSTLSL